MTSLVEAIEFARSIEGLGLLEKRAAIVEAAVSASGGDPAEAVRRYEELTAGVTAWQCAVLAGGSPLSFMADAVELGEAMARASGNDPDALANRGEEIAAEAVRAIGRPLGSLNEGPREAVLLGTAAGGIAGFLMTR